MPRRGGGGFTAQQVAELWTRWKAGDTLPAICGALAKGKGAVYAVLSCTGGIAPEARRRARHALTLEEREEITRGIAGHAPVRAIARALGRAPSTISREIQRHGGRLDYRATQADTDAWARAKRAKPCVLARYAALRTAVATQLAEDWSPQQIARWLVTAYPDDLTMRVSPETLYRSLYIQARGVLKKELIAHLRRRHPIRRRRGAAARDRRPVRIPDLVSISARPPEVADRAIPGHWEGDLLAGARNTHVATLVERASRYVHLVHVTGKDTTTVVNALIREAPRLPAALLRSLTWDRGTELAQHARFTVATTCQVYFCDPASPWQRGSNENTNGLLRQYFPKGTTLAHVTQADLDAVAHKLNTRPRMTLGWRTPAAVLAAAVATTG